MRPTLNESTEIIETVIEMSFDRLGRRVWMRESEGDTVTKEERFVYDGYLCVQRLDATQNNAVRTEFVWDPTEPVATRPLAMRAKNWGLNLFYSHDGNKNVSEVFYHAPQNGIAAHYDYAPFGAIIRTSSATRVTNRDLISENPFRFSSEYHDAPLSLVYYNYRHYQTYVGRWCTREPLEEMASFGIYGFVRNNPIGLIDIYGLVLEITYVTHDGKRETVELKKGGTIDDFMALLKKIKQERGKICEFYCGGHGSTDYIIINGVWEGSGVFAEETKGSLTLRSSGTEIFILEQIEKNGEPDWNRNLITAELKELLDKHALINLNACLTACEWSWLSNENLAERMSRALPNVRVKGSRGLAAGIPIWGQEPFLRIPRTYINGVAQ